MSVQTVSPAEPEVIGNPHSLATELSIGAALDAAFREPAEATVTVTCATGRHVTFANWRQAREWAEGGHHCPGGHAFLTSDGMACGMPLPALLPEMSHKTLGEIGAEHSAAAGALCVDGGHGWCRECGVGLEICPACDGVGYHRPNCPVDWPSDALERLAADVAFEATERPDGCDVCGAPLCESGHHEDREAIDFERMAMR